MGREQGQATVEWTGLLLLVALVLVAVGHLASKADGKELGTALAQSVTHPARADTRAPRASTHGPRASTHAPRASTHALPPPSVPATSLPRLLRTDALGVLRRAAPGALRQAGRDGLRRAGRGAGALWRRAWFACLVYERTRYAFRHPESRLPGYTLPYEDAVRMINNCVSPVDLLRDVPGLDPGR